MQRLGISRNELSVGAIRSAAEQWGKFDPYLEGAKLALVVARKVDFGLARMYEALRGDSPLRVRVFRNVAPAETWLDLPERYLDSHPVR